MSFKLCYKHYYQNIKHLFIQKSSLSLLWYILILKFSLKKVCQPHFHERTLSQSVTQSCLTLWDPMDCSTPGLPVHHQLPEFIHTHVYWVGDTIQPSHPLPSPSTPAFNPSLHQGRFQWVSSSYQVAKYWFFSFSISLSNE